MDKNEKKVCICRECKEQGEANIYHLITEKEKKKVMDMSIFQWKCGKCGYSYRFIYPCLYVDSKSQIAVRYRGEEEPFDFSLNLVDYCKRDCKTLEEFAEKVRIFNAELDDQGLELLKILIFAKLHVEDESLKSIYFYRKNPNQELEFTVYRGEEPDGICVSYDMYRNVLDLTKELPLLPNRFHYIDLEWAGSVVR